ncbi:Prefoldin beta-like protein [Nadsonia fulvescens var. elongata DSM 6958]|uniref:Prefoldin beta-like protein n=1 Tax=Nadsonia fulvescens var. elongata DSM 6958 TaxID=857566 RepID=A0A1E3PUV7_9ASCO|nr:Prefoldin beta-like protein [Nadsonia fulvescens var. elongata DSM 6958]
MAEEKQTPTPQVNKELQVQYDTFKRTLQTLSSKIGELEGEAEEHKLVLSTLTDVPKDRKCFRMVGGVLVEKTVGEVLPTLQTNSEGIKTVLGQLVQEYKKCDDQLREWQTKNKVQIVKS